MYDIQIYSSFNPYPYSPTSQCKEGTKYESAMMYFVNQETGTWSLLALYPDSIACVIAAGTKFTPYSE